LAEQPPRGDDVRTELPKDGAWVRYQAELEDLRSGKKYTRDIRLSFVGTAVEDGQTFRWLEQRESDSGGGVPPKFEIFKVLVPEKQLLESSLPFETVRRAWLRKFTGEIEDVTNKPLLIQGNFAPYLLWTPGMLKSSSLLEDQTKDIEYQRGRLQGATARSGKVEMPEKLKPLLHWTYTAWQHPDLPIGFAEARIASLVEEGAGLMHIIRLQDVGADAKTELPDQK
jgi:hypothetical protein